MPPKQRITREMILERSFEMFCAEGMGAVNARSVAKALNCSTQPIFSYYTGMDDLKQTLYQKALSMFESRVKEALQAGSDLDECCLTYIHFAAEQPNLFAHLFMRDSGNAKFDVVRELHLGLVQKESERYGVSMEQANDLMDKMWTCTHGLATLVAIGKRSFDEERVKRLLADTRKGFELCLKNP